MSATAEDVFCLYERNSTYYYNCLQQGTLEKCKTKYNNNCSCYERQMVYPITIGDQQTKCDFKRKIYIKFGQECPICIEPIIRKIDAYLTPCGHGFHKKCIFDAFETKWKTKWASQFHCPMCRCRLGQVDIENRYNCGFHEDKYHYIYQLDNFWINKDYRYCYPCPNGYNHNEGMKKNCCRCINYRKNGSLSY